MMRTCRRLRNEDGQTIIFMALVLPFVFGILLLAIDASSGFVHRRNLQNIADAAALAGADALAKGLDGGATASAYSVKNDWVTLGTDCTTQPVNCYQTPYIDKNGNSHPDKILVRVTQDCSTAGGKPGGANTFFGRAFNFLTKTTGYDCLKVSARAVGTVASTGTPPPISFASLNRTCNNHTLVIRLSGHLYVTNEIYVNSCSGLNNGKGDGFDIFGAGGDLKDPANIFTHGGWETHNGDLVYVGTNPSDPSGNTLFSCPNPPYSRVQITGATVDPTTGHVSGGTITPGGYAAYEDRHGCPTVGTDWLPDPFVALQPPDLSKYPVIANNSCNSGCYTVSEFTCGAMATPCPWWLDSTMNTADPSLVADKTTGLGTSNPANNSYVSVDGERMKVTNNNAGGLPAGSLGGSKRWAVTRGAACAPTCNGPNVHTEPPLTVDGKRRAFDADEAVDVVTLRTQSAHNLHVGDWVRVNLGDPDFDGVYQVSEIPDFESEANPKQFSYIIPGAFNHGKDLGQAPIVAVRRIGGEAYVTTSAASGIQQNDPVIVNLTSGDDPNCTFDEELDDGVTVDDVTNSGRTFSYAQPECADDVHGAPLDIKSVVRYEGSSTVTTEQNTMLTGFGLFATVDNAPDDTSFNAHVAITANNKLTYSQVQSGQAQLPDVLPDHLNVGVSDAQRFGGTSTLKVGNVTGLVPNTTYVLVHITDSGYTSFSGKFLVTEVDSGAKTFSYSQSGLPDVPPGAGNTCCHAPSSYDGLVPIQSFSRNNGVVTVVTKSPHGLGAGKDPVVDGTSNTTFNGTFHVLTVPTTTSFTYAEPGPNTGTITATDPSDGVTGDATAGGVFDETNDGAKVIPDDAKADGIEGFNTINPPVQCCAGPLFEIFKVDTFVQTIASAAQPAAYLVPAGTTPPAPLEPGIYYGGICIGAPAATQCGHKVGGSCNTSTTGTPGTVTLKPGVYIMAGGGFYVCGNSNLVADGVTIYNTEDNQALGANAGKLDQVYINTRGNVTLKAPDAGKATFGGMVIWQGKDPANLARGNLAVACDTETLCNTAKPKCDGRPLATTDIAFLNIGTDPLHHGLENISGTIYAPNEWTLFNDSVGGTGDLAVITGCTLINGVEAKFDFHPEHHIGLGGGLGE
jgi:Putative Flp pilus-assembly TadE/G-like